MSLRIFSFNVNGIRSAMNKGLVEWLKSEGPDIISLQEIKATVEQFDELSFKNMGYYCLWNSAQKKGYSGVGILTRLKPVNVEYGIGIPDIDDEGRVICTEFEKFYVVSVYFPSGTSGDIRQDIKMLFLLKFNEYINTLLKRGKPLIISGDYNIAHNEIDINHPKKHIHMSGFLPEERKWFTNFLSAGFIDSFRLFNGSPEQYSWWTYRAGAREKNLGWRIDYNLVSEDIKNKLKHASIHSDVYMSDHCPVSVEINI